MNDQGPTGDVGSVVPEEVMVGAVPDAAMAAKLAQVDRIGIAPVGVGETVAHAMTAFIVARSAEQVAHTTLELYHKRLTALSKFLRSLGIQEMDSITTEALRAWLFWLRKAGHNPGGVAQHYRIAHAFLTWYEEERDEEWRNPIRRIKAPRVGEEPLEPLSLEHLKALLKACNSDMAVRDRAILYFLADTGVRASELCNLNVGDVDQLTGQVTVRHGKGGKSRTVFLGTTARRALVRWLRIHDPGTQALFTTERGGTRLRYWGLRQIVRRLATRANIPAPGLHSFRRLFVINSLRSGMDLLTLQRLVGHAGPTLLARYAKQTATDLQTQHAAHGLDTWI